MMRMMRAQNTEIAPGVHRLPLFGTGAFLICEDTVTIVDAGWRWTSGRVLNQLHRLGRSPQEVSYIISTHMHLDHIGGMDHVKQHSSGRVAAHEQEVPDIDLFTLTGPYISNRILKTSNIGIPIHPHMEA